jgi:hypothetical protein
MHTCVWVTSSPASSGQHYLERTTHARGPGLLIGPGVVPKRRRAMAGAAGPVAGALAGGRAGRAGHGARPAGGAGDPPSGARAVGAGARLWVIAACLEWLAVTVTRVKPRLRNALSRWHTDCSSHARLYRDHGTGVRAIRTPPSQRASCAEGCFLHPRGPRGYHRSERKRDEVV